MNLLRSLTLSLIVLPACSMSVVGLSRDAGSTDTSPADAQPDTAPDSAPDTVPDAQPDTAPDNGIACDEDGDGERSLACGGADCDDHDRYRSHGLTEQCSGTLPDGRSAASHDEDCDPCTVNNPALASDGDMDGDHYASATCSNPWPGATAPVGCDRSQVSENASAQTEVGTDCDDSMRGVNPNTLEVCGNHVDDNCSGVIDEAIPGTVYRDADSDTHGDPAVGMSVASLCSVPSGWSLAHDDCDDTRAETHPGALEQCDGRDNDCSLAGGAELSEDMDGDHYAPLEATCLGAGEPGAIATAFPRTDCDDASPTVHPGALEACDRADSNCSSGGGADPAEDADNDGYASLGATCVGRGEAGAPAISLPKTDCDDTNASVNPGRPAAEDFSTCDGADNDCNTATSELTVPCAGGGFCAPGGVCAAALTLQQLAAGYSHTCARRSDGSVLCWGADANGQLGDGGTTLRTTAVAVTGLLNVVELVAGTAHTCARLNDGTVRCWGSNGGGSPTVVPGLVGAAGLGAGGNHTCARLNDGTARCWGSNDYGELGDGSLTSRSSPTTVPGLAGVVELVAGSAHTCARLSDSTIRCWGLNSRGQLGDGTQNNRASPTVVSGLTGVAALTAGSGSSWARLGDGTVLAWGWSLSGQLGLASGGDRTIPTVVPGLTNLAGLTAGYAHACARLSDGTARCWGDNALGDLGNNGGASGATPRVVPGLVSVVELVAGGDHTCARVGDRSVLCWGDNGGGETVPMSGTLNPTPVPGL